MLTSIYATVDWAHAQLFHNPDPLSMLHEWKLLAAVASFEKKLIWKNIAEMVKYEMDV